MKTRKNTLLALAMLLPLLAPSPEMRGAANEPQVSASDKEFAMKAAMGGMLEVELGQLAEKNAANSEVKSFGKMMVTDHSAANKKLKSVTTAKGIDLPDSLDAKHEAEVTRLGKLEGDAFDKAYVSAMVEDHVKDVAEFKKAAKDCDDAQLKQFAQDTLPVLEKHLEHIKAIQASMK